MPEAFGGSGDVGVFRPTFCVHCRGRSECRTCGNGRDAATPTETVVYQVWFRRQGDTEWYLWDTQRRKIADEHAYINGLESRRQALQYIYALPEDSEDAKADFEIRRITIRAQIIADPPERITVAEVVAEVVGIVERRTDAKA